MEDFVKIFKSPEGDVYHITLSEDSRVLSENIRETLGNVHVAEYYFHVIYREHHSMLASLIGNDIQEGLGK